MGKNFFSNCRTFAKNVGVHAKRVAQRKESAAEAVKMLRSDGKKLAQTLSRPKTDPEHRKHAQKLLKRGRARFNARDYAAAEKFFRAALAEDPECGWACTYLGHALYHQDRHEDAMAAWRRAYEMDPASDAGLRAKKKLELVTAAHVDYVSAYQERMGLK